MFQQLRNASVLTRTCCFLASASKLKIQKCSVKNSESLLNFSDLWNQNMELKIHTLCLTDFILFSNGIYIYIYIHTHIYIYIYIYIYIIQYHSPTVLEFQQ